VPSRVREASICSAIALRTGRTPGDRVHRAEDLGGQHDVLAVRVLVDGTADDLFGGPGLVAVRGVPEGDTELDGVAADAARTVQGGALRVGRRVGIETDDQVPAFGRRAARVLRSAARRRAAVGTIVS
jgi:hypothetical protein